MIHPIRKFLSITALGLSLTSTALAAAPGPDGNRGHLYRTLHNDAVLDHLGFTSEQKREAQRIVHVVVEEHREKFELALQPPTKPERVPLVAEVFRSITFDVFKRLEPALEPEQFARLRQIELQTFGLRTFQRPAIIAELRLDQKQSEAIVEIASEGGKRLSALHRSGSALTQAEKDTLRASIVSEGMKAIRQELTPLQWVRWELLKGARFEK